MTDDDASPYPVGYGRPPLATRFKPGTSGNPKGRRRGSKNFRTALADELKARVIVTENGERKTIDKRQAAMKQLVNKAVMGDQKAIWILLQFRQMIEDPQDGNRDAPQPLSHAERQTYKGILERLRKADNDAPQISTEPTGEGSVAADSPGDAEATES